MATSMLLGPLISMVKEKASSYLLEQYEVMAGMEEQHKIVKRKLPAILDVIADAEEQGARRAGVRAWLEELKLVAYEANEVFDEFKYEALRREAKKKGHMSMLGMDVLSLFPHHNPIVFRYRMGKKLCRIVRAMEVLVTEMNAFGFQYREQATSTFKQRPQTSSIIGSEIVSRVEEKEEIVTRLLQDHGDSKDMLVLPVVGMGGLGKTTLAQLVYNDPGVQNHFQLLMWVCVSDDFDVAVLAKMIIDLAINRDCGLPKDNTELLLQHLQKELTAKKYLLVLDDVWNRDGDKWAKLKACLLSGGAGSAILFTTRDEAVARIMGPVNTHRLAPLADDDLWAIFRRRAFSLDVQENSELVEIGRKIVKKCSGSPLAAKALGSVLSTKHTVGEWSAVLEKSSISDERNGILPILKLSYDDLPLHMKQCFAFCAVFPKDHEIDVETLIQLWMANDFIPSDDLQGTEVRGKEIFNELAWRSFFQDVKQVPSHALLLGNRRRYYCCRTVCKIHDLMHDVALSIMGKECSTVIREQSRVALLSNNVRHLYLSTPEDTAFLKVRHCSLQTIIYHRGFSLVSLRKYNSLRALSLQSNRFPIRPRYLKHLRYLDFSYSRITTLPESISTLYNLQTLKLSNCARLSGLPKDMRYMTSLRHLYTDGCENLKGMPPGLGQLTSLQTLTCFVVGGGSGCSNLREIKNLKLGGQLELCHLENVFEKDASLANLMAKKELVELKISWDKDHVKQAKDHEKVLNALKPHNRLQLLEVRYYKSTNFPAWVTDIDMLQSLVELHLIGCKMCKKLPRLWQLPVLQSLHLIGMSSLRCVCSGDMTGNVTTFPKLEELKLSNLKSLKEWWETEGREAELPTFPELEKMIISYCSELKTLPEAPKLKEIQIREGKPQISLLLTKYLASLSNLQIQVDDESNSSSDTSWSLEQNFAKQAEGKENWNPTISLQRMDLMGCSFFFSSSQLQPAIRFWKYFVLLEYLQISSCNILYWPEEEFQSLVSLKKLTILKCNNLTGSARVPEPSISARNQLLPRLESLIIRDCKSLVKVFNLPSTLRSIDINGCPKLECLSGQLDALESLYIEYCGRLTSLESCLGDLPSLQTLHLSGCQSLTSLPNGDLPSLQTLRLHDCKSLTSLPNGDLPSLQDLCLSGCQSLTSLPNGTQGYSSLQELTIADCPGIESLPECLQQRLDNLRLKILPRHLTHPGEEPEPTLLNPKSWKYAIRRKW